MTTCDMGIYRNRVQAKIMKNKRGFYIPAMILKKTRSIFIRPSLEGKYYDMALSVRPSDC